VARTPKKAATPRSAAPTTRPASTGRPRSAARRGARDGGDNAGNGTRDGAAAVRTRDGVADRSFGEVLRTKSVERILPEVLNRGEAGRRRYIESSVKAIDGEIELLREEHKRLQAEGTDDDAIARIDRALLAVTAEAQSQRAAAADIARPLVHPAKGFTVIGRVLQRGGTAPKGATVEFASDREQPVKELGSITVDADGSVRRAYPAELVTKMTNTPPVHTVVRVGQRIVASDAAHVSVAPDTLYQFDLRIDVTN
jgi:hypothetical protein